MKRNYVRVALLCLILLANIVFTQLMVHQYFFQHYVNALVYCGINLVLFPAAIFIYKGDQKSRKGEQA
ncbi:hypothetical protein RRU94_00130 [Domibacillus sp. DTU_2020_1001157_1_SI_ALB_TIR_016]|uniref:hypothetical protein n=1 Tax=Domibacillus sp. DTU_2020_1001157_1_SI_ALB_TIR_016 TaxID=3077789 RepID=UPI0028E589EF|nr:hypothetical protein [Domibacillus sp. DTU_2020_1001157_1_SI_ALB_TIR_016]WNS78419.1 hypothetical protein RRU94_00130 [Domibacillus sp. DTU_2020_1001157_1_SI_ALB_TIR_016]